MLDARIELMQRVPVFHGLARAQLQAIIKIGQKAFFEAGDDLVAEDENGDTSYLIVTGAAVCSRLANGQTIEEALGPGTFIGELAMLVDTVHNFTVTAKERLRALAIHRDAFRVVMEADLSIAAHISDYLLLRLRDIASDLRSMDSQFAELEQLIPPTPSFRAAGMVRSSGFDPFEKQNANAALRIFKSYKGLR